MNVDRVFELFNHFLATKEVGDVMSIATRLECFSSDAFSDGRVYYNAEAPAAFRVCVTELAVSKEKISLEVVGASGSPHSKIFRLKMRQGKESSSSVISIGMKGEKLAYFVQQNFE